MTKLQWKASIITAGVVIVGVIVLFAALPQKTQRAPDGRSSGGAPVPVLVATAQTADVPVYLDGVGTTKALNTVTVRPQIDGKLISVNFKEGQDVPKGYVLARIDPTTYQAQYDQAVAKKAQDEALLANARIDLERYRRLAATNSGPRQQADTQAATVAQLEAQVKSDQAAIDNAKAILEYTNIAAPLAGRTGIRQVDEGNIVHAADATGIVVLTQLRPISVLFSMPQQQLSQIGKAFSQGPLTVETLAGDNKSILDRGTLEVIDNQVDQTTGTVRLKANFPNKDLQQWPGQFVNVRLLINTLQQAIVVPTAAVQRGPSGAFVYVVNDDSTVSMRNVTVAQQDDTQAVIAMGVNASERVVTSGFAQLSDGGRITIGGEAPDNVPTSQRPRGRRSSATSDRTGTEKATSSQP